MPKHIIEFNLPEEREELESAMNGWKAEAKLEDIWNQVWRPRFKHGYNVPRLNELLETEAGDELFEILLDLYKNAIREE